VFRNAEVRVRRSRPRNCAFAGWPSVSYWQAADAAAFIFDEDTALPARSFSQSSMPRTTREFTDEAVPARRSQNVTEIHVEREHDLISCAALAAILGS